jgi:hypothetical protein
MAGLNRYECQVCGHLGDYIADQDSRPWHCDEEMVWTPNASAALDAKASFQETVVESGGRTYTVDSLHAMRKIERETERLAADRAGQPLVWRDYSQDKSNFDQHTLVKHMDRPVGGYADGTTGVDGKKFRKIVSDRPKKSIV